MCRIAAIPIFLFLTLAAFAQQAIIDLPHGNIKARVFIDSIEAKKWTVYYSREVLDTTAYIHVSGPVRLGKALQMLSERFGLAYTLIDSVHQVVLQLSSSYNTNLTVTLTDEYRKPLASANLWDSTGNISYQTPENGIVTVRSKQKQVLLIITYVGMITRRITLSGHGSMTIHMQHHITVMDQEIVTNYGTGNRRNSTSDQVEIPHYQLNDGPAMTPQTALEGLVPGLMVTRTSGMPGASSFLTIRSQGSIYNNSDPLYVIDGVVFAPGNQSMMNLPAGNAGNSLSPFSFLATSEIEKMDVLKDADATAIYGSRGANGVILITTRRYKPKAPRFTLLYSNGTGTVTRQPPLMNTPQYLKMRHDAFNYGGPTDPMNPFNAPDLLVFDTTRYTNWVRNLIGGIAQTNNIQLSFNSASRSNTWFGDLSALRETGVFPIAPVHQRANTCLSFDHHDKNNTWNVHVTGLAGIDENQQSIALDPTSFIFLAPDAPALHNSNGSLNFNPYYTNPLYFLEQPYQAFSQNYLVSGLANYNILPWLTIKTQAGFNAIGSHETGQTPISAQDPTTQPTATTYFARTFYSSQIIEPQAEVKKQWGKINAGFLLGYSWQQENASLSTQIDTGLTSDNHLRKPSPANALQDTAYPAMSYRYRALFGRVTFNFDELFIVNLTGRHDGSSRFGPGIHYAEFYAVGASFVFSRLQAIHDLLPCLSLGKLRGSMGVTGNDQIGDHRLQGYTPVNEPFFDNIPGFFSSNQVAAGATWETIHKKELALELGFINDRLLFTVARYEHHSTDQLLPLAYPQAGTPDVFRNWPAVLQNKGWEFTLSARVVDTKDVSWSVSVNWTAPVNKLVSFPDLNQTPFSSTLMIGQPLSVLQGWLFAGVDPNKGVFTFRDLNHDGAITQADTRVIGHLDPTGFGGLYTEFRYKHIELAATMDGRHTSGNNFITSLYVNNPPGSNSYGLLSNAPVELTKRWETPRDQARYQQVTTDTSSTPAGREISYYIASSARLTNASFIRLKKLRISWSLTDGAIKRMHISCLTIFLEGQDLFTFTPYKDVDPEIQNATILPPLRMLQVGVNMGI
jgi:TonB-linked SusC/RagA family outer membrane protein